MPLGSRSHTDKAVDVFNAVQEIVEPHALIPYLPAASDDRLGYRTAHDLTCCWPHRLKTHGLGRRRRHFTSQIREGCTASRMDCVREQNYVGI